MSAGKELVPEKAKAEDINPFEDDNEPEEEGNPPPEENLMAQGGDGIGGDLDKPEDGGQVIRIPFGPVEEGLGTEPIIQDDEKDKDDFNSYMEEDPAQKEVTSPLALISYRTESQVNLPKMDWIK